MYYYSIEDTIRPDVQYWNIYIEEIKFPRFSALKIGDYHFYGRGMREPDFPTALKWYRIACNSGNSKACFNAGSMSQLGIGTRRDFEIAKRLISCMFIAPFQVL